MELRNISPFALKPNTWNSNRVNRENFEKLKKSLETLGTFKPVLVREIEGAFEILAGFHRTEAAKELGYSFVPVLNLGKIDDDRAKEISLVDNTRYGEDDAVALSRLLDSFETDLLEAILPEPSNVDIPEIADALEKLSEEMSKAKEAEETQKTIKFRLETEKAEEVESILSKVASDNGLRFPDGYLNLSEALYIFMRDNA